MATTFDKARAALQQKLDSLNDGQSLQLMTSEFPGPLAINRSVTLDGQKATMWAPTGPVLTINAPNVTLKNFRVEVTGDGDNDPQDDCAIDVQSPNVRLENVEVRGAVAGLPGEEGAWRYPYSLALGQLPHGQEHEVVLRLYVPVACTIESKISGLDVSPHSLQPGAQEVRLKIEQMPQDIILNGILFLKTKMLQRLMNITAHILSRPGAAPRPKGAVVWEPPDWASLQSGTPPPPQPKRTQARPPAPRSQPMHDTDRPPQTMAVPDVQPADTEIWSPDMPPTPTTVTVSPKAGEGKYRGIMEAFKQVVPGSTIVVKPGTYKECLVIDKKIEIVADGPDGSVVVEGNDQGCVKVSSDDVVVRGLTLRGLAGRTKGLRFAVNVSQGKPQFEDCDITSDSLACVAVHGSGVDPSFRNCKMHGSRSAGVLVYDRGLGTFENCAIFENGHGNVEVREAGNPMFRRCQITEGKEAGVVVHDKGGGTFEDCEITGNALSGVDVRKGGNPVVRRCKIADGKHPGVRIDGGGGTFEDCEISGNTLSGVEVRQSSTPTFRKCRVQHNKQSGVLVRKGQGIFDDCHVSGNALNGVEVRESGAPTLRRCHVYENGEAGAVFTEKAKAKCEDCHFHHNAQANVEIRSEAAPTLKDCKIHEGRQVGVLVCDQGTGVLEECDVWGNAWAGVAVTREGKPTVKKGQIRNGQQGGFVAWGGGSGFLERVQIFANAGAGVSILGSSVVVRECKINRNGDVGVWADAESRGRVDGSDLRGNTRAALELATRAVTQSGNLDRKA
jgi:F-box protein 11